MIEHRIGNMLEEATNGFLVHGCNCQGVMGSGIARSIRDKWPAAYSEYRDTYKKGYYDIYQGVQMLNELRLGTIIPVEVEPGIVVVNAMTQRFYQGHPDRPHGKRYVNYESVARAFEKMNNELPVQFHGVDLVLHFPLIGAGLAKGDWNIISNIIDHTVTNFDKVLWTLE